ncbi:broad specificity phosphatase PhoE [Sphingomonas zeicaulis]|uniref:histidine phosphatase family protein n=1 Tax=Sphingomonas zeicaulis TaxID=1632740 RepID=UPI003D242746
MSVRVHLMRHGAHGGVGRMLTGRNDDGGLTEAGRRQVEAAAAGMKPFDVVRIEASPRRRTQETAQIIADTLGVPVLTVDALDELDFGAWTGRSFAALDQDPSWHAWNSRRSVAVPPGGEPMTAAVRRVSAHLNMLAHTDAGAAIVCISHCDIIRGAIAHYLGLGLDHLLNFDIDPGSISTLLVGDWGGRITSLNRSCE